LEEMKVETVDEKLSIYKSNWLRRLTRMNNQHDARNNTEL
jgi:hypothetical protein